MGDQLQTKFPLSQKVNSTVTAYHLLHHHAHMSQYNKAIKVLDTI
jgi:hypothetical protein